MCKTFALTHAYDVLAHNDDVRLAAEIRYTNRKSCYRASMGHPHMYMRSSHALNQGIFESVLKIQTGS